MQPTALDFEIIRALAPLQQNYFLVDSVDVLADSPLVNGFVFAVPWFLYWHFAEGGKRWLAQYLLLTSAIATGLGIMASLLLQQFFTWPPPAAHPLLKDIFTLAFQENLNPNSFPSDSTILFCIIALGTSTWNKKVSISLFTWLLLFVAPSKIFVGGHYPSDILAGLLIGLFSFWLARHLAGKIPPLEILAGSSSAALRILLFLFLFEVGNGFRDLRDILRTLIHVQRHL